MMAKIIRSGIGVKRISMADERMERSMNPLSTILLPLADMMCGIASFNVRNGL